MSDLFRRLSEQVSNRAAVVQPLRASRFALAPDMNLPSPMALRHHLSAPVLRERGGAVRANRLPEPLVPSAGPYRTWPIPSVGQLGRVVAATGGAITPRATRPHLAANDAGFAEAVDDSTTSTVPGEIDITHGQGSFASTPANAGAANDSGAAAAAGAGSRPAGSSVTRVQPSGASVAYPLAEPSPSAPADGEDIMAPGPAVVRPGVPASIMASGQPMASHVDPVLPYAAAAPEQSSSHKQVTATRGEPPSLQGQPEPDMTGVTSAAVVPSLPAGSVPATPLPEAAHPPAFTMTTDAERTAERPGTPLRPGRDAPPPPERAQAPAMSDAPAPLAAPVVRQTGEAPPAQRGAEGSAAPTSTVQVMPMPATMPSPGSPVEAFVASPAMADTGRDTLAQAILPTGETHAVALRQKQSEVTRVLPETPPSVPTYTRRRELPVPGTAGIVAIADNPASPPLPVGRNPGERVQPQAAATAPVNQSNRESMQPALVDAPPHPAPGRPGSTAEEVRPRTESATPHHLRGAQEPAQFASGALTTGIRQDPVSNVQPLAAPAPTRSNLTPSSPDLGSTSNPPWDPQALTGEAQAETRRPPRLGTVQAVRIGAMGQPAEALGAVEPGTGGAVVLRPRGQVLAPQSPPRQREEPPMQITVHVTIGRVEVRHATEAPQPIARRRAAQPALSLDAYLMRTQRGQA